MVDMRMWRGNMRDLRELILDQVDMSRVESKHELDNALSTMYSLVRLQMVLCFLCGEIPPSVANLTNITHLNLRGNVLNGSIPSALLSLPRVQQVDLSENSNLGGKLSSIIPQHSASLHTLILHDTAVGGSIPDFVANISSLTVLDLHDCLVESIPSTMANLTVLEKLDLSYNLLRGPIPQFGVGPTLGGSFPLTYIDLSHNQLDGRIPPMIFTACPNLQSVDLSDNQLTGTIPSPAGDLRYLKQLHLSSNALTGKIPTSLAKISSLISLDLNNNKLSDKIPSFGRLVSMESLVLGNNKFEGEIPPSIVLVF